MTVRQPDEILVGVGGSGGAATLAFVAAEIARYGGSVRLAHAVVPLEHSSVPTPLAAEGDTVRVVGTRVLGDAAAHFEHALPEVSVHASLLRGSVSHALVDASLATRRVVLERRPRTRTHLHTLAVVGHVAAHAPVPVVVLPPEWHPDPEREGTVLVGVEDVLTSPQLLATALEEAAARGAQLRIVHAWYHSDLYDGVAFAGPALQRHESDLVHQLARELEPALRRRPGVPHELAVVHGRPADVLVDESRRAGLLVLGRHQATVPWGSHLGSVARAVLRDADCPVLVLDTMAPRERHHRQFSSGTIEMAPAGHSDEQIAQPLQKSRLMT
ncbi:universal stress protein [Nocardioides pyridinolyticus]